ncbi:MAG: metallophosphoesterase [Pseudomonadota bacterium]
MTAFRFIHASDLHLGKAFAAYPEEVRGRLREVRHGAIARLAAAARGHGAADVLLAGDTFDTETPSEAVWRQALAAFGAAEGIRWWLIPGNHDSLAAEALWDQIRRQAPPGLHVLDRQAVETLAPGVCLMPAPLPRRFPGRDLTDWMSGAATAEGAIRIGLAHGRIQSFDGTGEDVEVIPPDRPATAGLAYLALGDWHGARRIGPRCHYSGTPEHDRFRHEGRGVCLAVTLDGPDGGVEVTPVETGQIAWHERRLAVTPAAEAPLGDALPGDAAARRDVMLALAATGRCGIAARQALEAAVAAAAPLFLHLDWDPSALATEYAPGDLDDIATGGALRLAAEALQHEAEAGPEAERAVAAAALNRLYSLLREGEA